MVRLLSAALFLLIALTMRADADIDGDFGFNFEVFTISMCRGPNCAEYDVAHRRIISVRVTNIRCGGPSDNAGMLPGDEIVALNDVTLHGISIPRFVMLVQESGNGEMKLKIVRELEGEFKEMEFTLQKSQSSGACVPEESL